MPQPDAFVGIDVAKNELVIHLHPAGTRWCVANDKTGLAGLGRRLVRIAASSRLRIGFEASGGYERALAGMLDRLGSKPISSILPGSGASRAPSAKSPRPTRSMPRSLPAAWQPFMGS
jgi:hypothetical protein